MNTFRLRFSHSGRGRGSRHYPSRAGANALLHLREMLWHQCQGRERLRRARSLVCRAKHESQRPTIVDLCPGRHVYED